MRRLIAAAFAALLAWPAAAQLISPSMLSSSGVTCTGCTLVSPILSGGTQGSVLFLGAGGAVSQDNAGLFFDAANNRLGINTASPVSTLTVDGTFRARQVAASRYRADYLMVGGLLRITPYDDTGLTYIPFETTASNYTFSTATTGGFLSMTTILSNGNLGVKSQVLPQAALDVGISASAVFVNNGFTDASNYDRGIISWGDTANVLTIGTQNAGSFGTARNMQFKIGGTQKLNYGVTTAGRWTSPDPFSASAYYVGVTAGVSCGAGTVNPVTTVVTNGIITTC